MRIKARILPTHYRLTEQERAEFTSYIAEYVTDYPGLTPSDMRQLEKAALDHILGLRLIAESLEQNKHIGLNSRYSYQQMERAILNDLALSRAARLKEKPATSSEADELRELLMGVSRIPTSTGKN